jgi:L-proline amide hydrolase
MGFADFGGHQTWYRVTGQLDRDAGRAPLVVLHGGPGAAHDYTLAMTSLADDGRAVVHYDQLGCGRSTHLPDADPSFWTVDLFVAELRNLVDVLGIGDRFHLLGQSWGGMLGPEVVLSDSSGISSLTICDSPASMPLWLAAAAELRAVYP